jgi:hypothetical protein
MEGGKPMTNETNDLLRAVPTDPVAAAVTAWKALLEAQIAATPDAWERTQIQSGVAACKSLLRKLALAS